MNTPPTQRCNLSQANVQEVFETAFAPWVQAMGLCDFEVGAGRVRARLPHNSALQRVGGSVCGQALMAAVDTVNTLAMFTADRMTKGTVYQHTHFLRAAAGGDVFIEASVLRFGKASAFSEVRVTDAQSGELLSQSSAEFAF